MPQLSQDRNLPKAITNLRLCSALKNCGVKVNDAFDKSTKDCLYAYDDKNLGYSDWVDKEPLFVSKCFKANNPNGNTIVLLPLDGRIIKAKNVIIGGICDSMLLTEQAICFVEFKTNATSTSSLRILDNATDAKNQLWHTFDGIIRPRCAIIDTVKEIDFHVAFDEELVVTGAQAQLQDIQNDFLDDKKYPLYFDNEKTFL